MQAYVQHWAKSTADIGKNLDFDFFRFPEKIQIFDFEFGNRPSLINVSYAISTREFSLTFQSAIARSEPNFGLHFFADIWSQSELRTQRQSHQKTEPYVYHTTVVCDCALFYTTNGDLRPVYSDATRRSVASASLQILRRRNSTPLDVELCHYKRALKCVLRHVRPHYDEHSWLVDLEKSAELLMLQTTRTPCAVLSAKLHCVQVTSVHTFSLS